VCNACMIDAVLHNVKSLTLSVLLQALLNVASSADATGALQPAALRNTARAVFDLLATISSLWCMREPTLIAGLDCDRVAAVQRLQSEPAGTAIVRASLTHAGDLTISYRVRVLFVLVFAAAHCAAWQCALHA
jgi:hypothetical protein